MLEINYQTRLNWCLTRHKRIFICNADGITGPFADEVSIALQSLDGVLSVQ